MKFLALAAILLASAVAAAPEDRTANGDLPDDRSSSSGDLPSDRTSDGDRTTSGDLPDGDFPVVIGEPVGAGPNPSEIYVEELKYGGSGCPQGSVGQSIAEDRQTYTLIFDKYLATIGNGVPITEGRKNCQLNIKMHVPKGWHFTVLSSDFRGYMQLDQGVRGTHKSTFYFAGDARQASSQFDYVGPQDQDFTAHDEMGVQTRVWSPCGKNDASVNLNINSQVRMLNEGGKPDAQGLLTNDSQDGHFQHKMVFQWQRC